LHDADRCQERLSPKPAFPNRAEVAAIAVPTPAHALFDESAERVREDGPHPRAALVSSLVTLPQDEPSEPTVVTADARLAEERFVLELVQHGKNDCAPVGSGPAGYAGDGFIASHARQVVQEAHIEHPVRDSAPQRGLGLEDVLPAADAADPGI